jgi:hypothetical protein
MSGEVVMRYSAGLIWLRRLSYISLFGRESYPTLAGCDVIGAIVLYCQASPSWVTRLRYVIAQPCLIGTGCLVVLHQPHLVEKVVLCYSAGVVRFGRVVSCCCAASCVWRSWVLLTRAS